MTPTVYILFSLLMVHNGQLYWLGAYETWDTCHDKQVALEADPAHKGDQFACFSVPVIKT